MPAVVDYLAELAARLGEVLGFDLVGVYAGGSYALGGYEPGRSDLDVAAVVQSPLDDARADEIVARVRHEALACPARGLELVVYCLAAVASPSTDVGFELNFNTGSAMAERLDRRPDPDETHWFPIDRSILAQAGVAIVGPPAGEVFAPIPRAQLLPVLETALRWHLEHEARPDDAVLNACRAWRFAAEGAWSLKDEAGRWALARGSFPVVEEALAARCGGDQPDPRAARAFARRVMKQVKQFDSLRDAS